MALRTLPKKSHPISATSGDVRRGAQALVALIEAIRQKGEMDIAQAADLANRGGDPRDYKDIARKVRAAIELNVIASTDAHAEGFIRGLAHLLSLTGDGCTPPLNWDPIRSTAASFHKSRPAVCRMATALLRAPEVEHA